MTLIELLTTGEQLLPTKRTYKKAGVEVPTKAEADEAVYLFEGVPLDKHIIALQIRGGLDWQHDYEPGALTMGAPDLTHSFLLANEPIAWQFYVMP